MTPKQKKEWIRALLSEEYRQGKHYLHRKGKYCCLGVACEVLEEDSDSPAYITHGSKAKLLPMNIQSALADMNDWGVPFEMIAGFIQENVRAD